MDKNINIKVRVWRQKGPKVKGNFETYELKDISQGSSFLEMMDILNEQLINEGKDPVVFDHDCREGICGMCSLYINGFPHGPDEDVTTCQLHMRKFNDGDTITADEMAAHAVANYVRSHLLKMRDDRLGAQLAAQAYQSQRSLLYANGQEKRSVKYFR